MLTKPNTANLGMQSRNAAAELEAIISSRTGSMRALPRLTASPALLVSRMWAVSPHLLPPKTNRPTSSTIAITRHQPEAHVHIKLMAACWQPHLPHHAYACLEDHAFCGVLVWAYIMTCYTAGV